LKNCSVEDLSETNYHQIQLLRARFSLSKYSSSDFVIICVIGKKKEL